MAFFPRALLLLSVAVTALAAPGPAAAARHKAPTCKRHGTTTVAKNEVARVFSTPRSYSAEGDEAGERLYGCLRSVGRPLGLADAYDDGYVYAASWGDVRLAGRFVAWRQASVDISCKADCPPGYESTRVHVGVADLRRRRVRLAEGWVADGALVLTSTGAIAWAQGTGAAVSVRATDKSGLRTLDTGAIAPSSLGLRRSTVSWVRDGVRRSATLR